MSWGSFLTHTVTELIPPSLPWGPLGGFPEMVLHAWQGLRKCGLAPPRTPAEYTDLFQGLPRVTRDGRGHSSRHREAGIVTGAVRCVRFVLGEQNRNRGLLSTLFPGGRFDRREGHTQGTILGPRDQEGMTRKKYGSGSQPQSSRGNGAGTLGDRRCDACLHGQTTVGASDGHRGGLAKPTLTFPSVQFFLYLK